MSVENQTASLLLAASVKDLFPKAKLLHSGCDRVGFFHDFLLEDQQIDQQALQHIEDRMSMIVREGVEMGVMEMVRANAAAFLRRKGEPYLAGFLEEGDEPLVCIGRLGERVDLLHGSLMESISLLKAFKLLEAEGTGEVRIRGVAAEDSQQLKRLVKTINAHKKYRPDQLAQEMGLVLVTETPVWLGRGEKVLKVLQQLVDNECVSKNFNTIIPVDDARVVSFHPLHIQVQKRLAQPGKSLRLAQYGVLWRPGGLIFDHCCLMDQQTAFCQEGEAVDLLKSSLQFILKTYNILGFECQWHLCIPKGGNWSQALTLLEQALTGMDYCVDRLSERYSFPAIALSVEDVYGNRWFGPYVGVSGDVVYRSLLGPHDGLIALLLEKNKGVLPLWLAPEHVCIVTLNKGASRYAAEIGRMLTERRVRCEVDESGRPLALKVRDAELARTPYVIAIGEREVNEQSVTLRRCGNDKETRVELNTFLNEVVQELMEKGY